MTKSIKRVAIIIAATLFIGIMTNISCIVIKTSDPFVETTDEGTKEQQKEEPVGKVDILNHQSYIDDGYYHVVGEVQNNTHKVERVEIIATFYDSAGQVVATDSNLIEMYNLKPGQKSNFEVNNVGEDRETTSRISRYELQVKYSPL